jgi:hypothetical protein
LKSFTKWGLAETGPRREGVLGSVLEGVGWFSFFGHIDVAYQVITIFSAFLEDEFKFASGAPSPSKGRLFHK